MSDLIRREDVFEALGITDKSTKYGGDHSGYNTLMLYEIKGAIDSIPTAEPNWIPLHFDEYKMTSDYPNEMDGKWVIVTDGENISIERIKKDAYDHFYPNGRWFEMENVIAWMPLPKHYEMEMSE